MTKGPKPLQALREAMEIAGRQWRVCVNGSGRGLLYDFTVALPGITLFVKVRRTRTVLHDMSRILSDCDRDLGRIRRVPATAVAARAYWLRAPFGSWRFFLVLDDRLVEIPVETMPVSEPGARHLRGDAPGPDYTTVLPEVTAAGIRFTCPFMGSTR